MKKQKKKGKKHKRIKPTIRLEKQRSIGSSPETCRYEYDFDYLVFNDDSETDEDIENDDGMIIERWSKTKKHRLLKCMWKLKYNRIISSFYLDSLKKKEGKSKKNAQQNAAAKLLKILNI